jgi:aspartate/glutamate racemase
LTAPRVALIHALALSVAPINRAFDDAWPQARRMNLLDDSLSADLDAAGRLDDAMTQRFIDLAAYAVRTGADGILYTCSAFGPCIDAVKARWPDMPVLKPNEAMVAQACEWARAQECQTRPRRIGLIATFAPTLASMPAEFDADVSVSTRLAAGALPALNAGDAATHDRLAVDCARALVSEGCELIALAQFSLARAAPAVREATSVRVLTTVDSAVERMKQALSEKR